MILSFIIVGLQARTPLSYGVNQDGRSSILMIRVCLIAGRILIWMTLAIMRPYIIMRVKVGPSLMNFLLAMAVTMPCLNSMMVAPMTG